MGKLTQVVCFTAFSALLFGSPSFGEDVSRQSFLDEQTMGLVNGAVFEVVVLKPTKDSLTYEKPLPLDLIPYIIRTDKYYSVGTAFAVGADQFVTAAHVMNLGQESQFSAVFLRDKDGAVYAIDKITKYSSNRDFTVFSLKNKAADRFLQVNKNPQINQRVFAVGNALGQGIVVRDGLYTSNTPEEENGEWKWLRFSAAASPGNSGGPLLDKDGKVVGIVLQKSENENLNYALPISEVLNAKLNTAVSHAKAKYVLDNMDMTKMGTFDKAIALPKSYPELNNEMIGSYDKFSSKLLRDLLAENRENIFPRGKGSTLLLNKIYNATFPGLIMKGEDGNWDAFYPTERKTADLGSNGSLTHGNMARSLFISLQKPDDVPAEKFYGDSKLFMDLILKGIYFYREIASEKIKVVSLGKAQEEYVFADSYGRKWLVRTWLLEYSDMKVLTFSLPVPGGFVTVMRTGQTGQVNSGFLPDMKVLANYVCASYYGTFKQWREFLKMKTMLPAGFSAFDISFDHGKAFRYKSTRLSFSYAPEVMDITDKSDLNLTFSFFMENEKVVWDVVSVVAGEDKNTKTSFAVSRKSKPPKELNDSYHSEWGIMTKQKFPYNGSAYYKDGDTIIRTIHLSARGVNADPAVFYTVTYQREGNVDQKEMESRLEKINHSVTILEGN